MGSTTLFSMTIYVKSFATCCSQMDTSHVALWLSERYIYLRRMHSPTLSKKCFKILCGAYGPKICCCINLKNFLMKFCYYCNYLLNCYRINVIVSQLVYKNL